jgi:two-component system cell cycle response regulator DivK
LEVSHGNYPYTILIAEDFDDTRSMIKRMLQTNGYRVVEAANGQDCPDLILMDLNMPLMDGLEATEQIRECRGLCSDVVILAITAHDTYGMKEAAIAAGCDGYLTKPIDFKNLEKILDRLLPVVGDRK